MTGFQIIPAVRTGIVPLIGFWGGTGGGKTESALRFARGLAGPTGKVTVIDTEGRRASYYADRVPRGFDTINFDAPYTPERYLEAYKLAEASSDVVVIDSASHCWEGEDGILDLHEATLDRMTKGSTDWKERERLNWPAWREPKERFRPLRNALLAHKKPLILCFRGKIKTRMVKEDGRNTVVTDTTTSPIFEGNFIFEMHLAIEVFQKDGTGGFIRFPMPYAKTSHADIRRMLPAAETEQISEKHGAALKAWSDNRSQPVSEPTLKDLKRRLWEITRSIHSCEAGQKNKQALSAGVARLNEWAVGESVWSDTESWESLTVARLPEIIEAAQKALA